MGSVYFVTGRSFIEERGSEGSRLSGGDPTE